MKAAIGLLLLVTAAATGCVTAPAVRMPNPMPLASTDPVTVENVAGRILTDMRFTLVRPSSRPGVLVTEPLTGDTWFEFWRDDTVGNDQRIESSLHTVRRVVTVTVTLQGGGSEVAVRVVKSRASAPGLAPENITYSLDLFDASNSELVRQDELVPSHYKWVPLGRDEALEQVLLERIKTTLTGGQAP
jgi:hypothetical protein